MLPREEKSCRTEAKSGAGTGLYYYGARYYDPSISLWLSVDPLAEQAPHMSPYAYAFNNPVFYTDPDGRWPWPTKNDPWVKGAGFFSNIFKNSARIHADNYANTVGGNVKSGAGWGYHVFYSSEEGLHKANFKKGSNSTKPHSTESFGNLSYVEGHSLEMGSILDIPVDLALYGLAGAGEALGLSGESAAAMAGVMVFINDVKGLEVNKIINNVDDLIKSAGKFKRGKTHIGENTVKGNIDDVFNTITQGGEPTKRGAMEMPDGRVIHKHKSTHTGQQSITVDEAGKRLKKIRMEND